MDIPNDNLTKNEVRQQVWDTLEQACAAEIGVHGRIPAFFGAQKAAARLAELPAWRAAKIIKAVPDRAQAPVRALALAEGKLVYMAVPKLASVQPFRLLDRKFLTVTPKQAALHQKAMQVGRPVTMTQMRSVDLIVCGSVAVNSNGVRIGKGAGYTDLEVALLTEAGLIGTHTTIVTTVHQLQILDQPLPETEHDFRVDFIVTPETVITCGSPRRPTRLHWDHIGSAVIEAIPVLAAMQRSSQKGL
jgi:5-formyltetrahydrofolate cyclo-ligase